MFNQFCLDTSLGVVVRRILSGVTVSASGMARVKLDTLAVGNP